jgi:VWFA-related protein
MTIDREDRYMRGGIFLVSLFFSVTISLGQTPRPSASPTPPADEDVVKITTSLIQVDVTVTDSKGRIITDLRSDEIEIYENSKKQKISNFAFVSNARVRTEQADRRDPSAPAPPTARLREGNVRRTIAIVVDDLTLSFESVHHLRRALRRFVDEEMLPGDLVAIVRAGGGVGALQQFTSDKQILHAAIDRVKWNPSGIGGVTAFARLEPMVNTSLPGGASTGARSEEGMVHEFNTNRANYFVTGTLGAVNYVVRGMAELPGRKSVMLFSDGFTLYSTDADGNMDVSRIMESLRALIDQANRASVVVYTLDPRGLQVTGLTAADNTWGRSAQQIQEAMKARSKLFKGTQDGLVFLAEETGGFAVINSNDLPAGVRRVIDDQSYYLVAYTPDDETFDPAKRKFNQLDVKVLRKDARVRYRSGFFGVGEHKRPGSPTETKGNMVYAITSPFAVNEIPLRLNAVFGVEPDQTTYVRSLLHVSAKDITFENASDGGKTAKFDVLVVGFGDNGVALDSLAKSYTITLDKARYDEFLGRGFVYDLAFPVKKPGAYQLRIAVKDGATNKIGSASQFVEVPDLKNKLLTLSGVAVENISLEVWNRRNAGGGVQEGDSNPLIDTALRQFKRGTVLNYGLNIHNAQTPVNLTSQVRLFREGKQVFVSESKPVPAKLTNGAAAFLGSLSLPIEMETGEYALQVLITDNNIKGKDRVATQFIQFEIVE